MMTLIQPFQPNPKLPCKNAKKGENDKNPHHFTSTELCQHHRGVDDQPIRSQSLDTSETEYKTSSNCFIKLDEL